MKANAYGHGAGEVGLALERAGAAMLACADIEEGIVLRRAGVQIPILIFGALGISELQGVFEFDLTPTISTPSAAPCPAGRRGEVHPESRSFRRPSCSFRLQAEGLRPFEASLPPEDRHRHEPSRFSPRQPGADAARDRKTVSTSRSTPCIPTSPPRTSPSTRRSASSASGSRRSSRRCRPSGSRRNIVTRRTARRCCATSASGTTLSAPVCSSTGSCRRRSPRCCRCDLPCHSTVVSSM